jgi:hypothetical protein
MEINRDLLRWILLIGATPIWWPFLRTLWKDFNAALREEGGLLGAPPSGRELEVIRREREQEPDTLTSEPLVRPGEHRMPRLQSPSARPQSAPPETRKPGFRSGPGPGPRR